MCTGHHHHHHRRHHKVTKIADMSTNQFMNQSTKMNQGLIITGQMILRNRFLLTKMQHGFQKKGDYNFSDNDVGKDDVDDEEDGGDVHDVTRCNDSTRMAMVCEMPEWNSNDLWIEAAPPILPQETSLAWEKQVRYVDGWFCHAFT